MNKLLALADRVEKLTGADREVDALIWCELRGVRYQGHHKAYGCEETQVEFTRPPKRTREVSNPPHLPHALAYTASLDAAMTLVPEGHTIQISDWDHETLRQKGPWQAIVLPFGARGAMKDFTFTNRCDHAATPALALTCAALRARAHGGGEG